MSVSDTENCSETNWELIDSLSDDRIDRSELPPLDDSFFARASWRMPAGQVILPVAMEPDLLAWFQAQGSESEQRMMAALRIYVEAHKDALREAGAAA